MGHIFEKGMDRSMDECKFDISLEATFGTDHFIGHSLCSSVRHIKNSDDHGSHDNSFQLEIGICFPCSTNL